MDREQFYEVRDYTPKNYNNFGISYNEFTKDNTSRTLIYGYTSDRQTFHVYLWDGQVTLYLDENTVKNTFKSYSDLVPDKRVYPEHSDYEFCMFLKRKGVFIPFTTYKDRTSEVFHGPIHTP